MQKEFVVCPAEVCDSPSGHATADESPEWASETARPARGANAHGSAENAGRNLQEVGDERASGRHSKQQRLEQLSADNRTRKNQEFAGYSFLFLYVNSCMIPKILV